MKVAIHTLGCKVNQFETQALAAALTQGGHVLVPFSEKADAYIVNTCTVTAISDQKSRQAVRGAKRRNPDALVAVCGCYAQINPEAAAALGADLTGGTGDRLGFVRLLEDMYLQRPARPAIPPVTAVDEADKRQAFEILPAGGLEGRTRAMLKVEDGCDNFCAYCSIPYARGPVRSLPAEQAAAEGRRLQSEGYRELVLTGIEISSWGKDLEGGQPLISLIERVCACVPDMRVRLGSLEPRTVTEEFCRRAARLENLCPQFHLSLQSGCDATLKRMGRRYDTARYEQALGHLRAYFDRPGLTTDVIVGFPGEYEGEFARTLSFLKACAFSKVHIFPYSRRPGTPAADMAGQVPKAVKRERAARAAAVADELERRYLQQWTGASLPVLFETERDGLWRGFAPQYVEVRAAGENLHNQIKSVVVERAEDGYLAGRVE